MVLRNIQPLAAILATVKISVFVLKSRNNFFGPLNASKEYGPHERLLR